jgi:hypothetical protein
MKKYLLFLGLASCFYFEAHQATAQGLNLADVTGIPLQPSRYTGYTGSPFLNDNWTKGEIIRDDAKIFGDLELKYDIYKDLLIIRKDNKEEFEVDNNTIRGFNILNRDGKISYFRNGFEGVGAFTRSAYFQVHFEGKGTKFISKHTTKLTETPAAYGVSVSTKGFVNNEIFYLLVGNRIEPVKRNKSSILKALQGDKKITEEIIKKNKLNLSRTDDISTFLGLYEAQQ